MLLLLFFVSIYLSAEVFSLEKTIELDHEDIAKLHRRIAAISKIAS